MLKIELITNSPPPGVCISEMFVSGVCAIQLVISILGEFVTNRALFLLISGSQHSDYCKSTYEAMFSANARRCVLISLVYSCQ